MSIFRRKGRETPDRYADAITVLVRYTPEQERAVSDYEVATVLRLAARGDVQAEEIEDEVLRWLAQELGPDARSEYAVERERIRHAAGDEVFVEVAILVSVIGGAASGIAQALTERAADHIQGRLPADPGQIEPVEGALQDLDSRRFAVARAFDIRPSDLSLVEQRSSDRHYAAIFEHRSGRFYGVRSDAQGAVTIRRLQPGDW
jgi:hypothetical protein